MWNGGLRYLLAALSLAMVITAATCWNVARQPTSSRISVAALAIAFAFALAALTLAFAIVCNAP